MTRPLKHLTGHLVLAVFGVIALVPLLLVLINSFKSNAEVLESPFGLPARWASRTSSPRGPTAASAPAS